MDSGLLTRVLTRLAELLAQGREFAEDDPMRLPAREARVVAEHQDSGGGQRLVVEDILRLLVAVGAVEGGLDVLLVEVHTTPPFPTRCGRSGRSRACR